MKDVRSRNGRVWLDAVALEIERGKVAVDNLS